MTGQDISWGDRSLDFSSFQYFFEQEGISVSSRGDSGCMHPGQETLIQPDTFRKY